MSLNELWKRKAIAKVDHLPKPELVHWMITGYDVVEKQRWAKPPVPVSCNQPICETIDIWSVQPCGTITVKSWVTLTEDSITCARCRIEWANRGLDRIFANAVMEAKR